MGLVQRALPAPDTLFHVIGGRLIMSRFRSAVVGSVLITQIWAPVLAQTLPITVDKRVSGQKPVVGISNGVPVINVAPPTAGGVSNNRFVRFNVGPSGVVLNNSGAASQTQVAGQVAGNPMLGNQRATTILNQVTAPNPSQLMGMLEVAGNRANVIVANPAGITCNGCGFMNANRATLTTGKPVSGPDGTLAFEIAGGRLAIEGAGLYGANLSQLDLLARTLEINAQVWADRLNVVAGAARVGHDGIDVSALTSAGAGEGVALDVAALGGMYANSIRLIGTEAGVGVNIGGNLAALTGRLTVSANGDVRILPSGRVQAATDLSVRSARDVVNGGTVAAASTLALTAGGKLVNDNAMSSAADTRIVARQFENRGALTAGLQADGAIRARGALSAQVEQLLNPGTLVAGGDATVSANALDLSGGKFVAGGALTLDARGAITHRAGSAYGGSVALRAASLDNTGGKIASVGALDLRTVGAIDNTGGTVAARQDLALTTGTLDNDGKIHAGRDLKIAADTLTNRAGGELIAVRNNALRIGGPLANAGLIDGGYTRITAGNLVNTGRIYGDRVGIRTPLLQNEPNAVIASRGDADLGVGTLTNREHALVHAAGDLRIGGALDGTGKATGQATLLANESATLEAARNADIAAASIRNRNLHFASETAEVSRETKWFYRLDGTTDIVDGTGMWFCNTVKSICGRDPSWMGPYDERRLLMPSARYPESRYGPPFDYSNIQRDQQGRAGVSAPIGLAYVPETYHCGGGDAGDCHTRPAQFRYEPDAKIWAVFDVERPSGIRRPPSPDACGRRCPADLAQQQARYDHDLVLYDTLNQKIKAFNADFRNSRMIKDFTFYQVTEIARETRITQSDPGKIIVGANARLSGNIINDRSRILAGGTLKTEGGTLSNVGAEGLRTVDRVGTMAYTYEKNDSRKYNRSDYNATVQAERIETGLGAAHGGAAVAPSGQPDGSTVDQTLPPATLTRITLPGRQTIAIVVLPPTLPSSKRYQVITAPDAPYLIATDSRFIGARTVVSSDFLLEKLKQDPGHILKRLGDGFYEQKRVAEQLMLATGQRFVGDYTDNETQYKALLSAGADFANAFSLSVGTALTVEQLRRLTRDIVWMVAQTVTLPDGTQQQVLAPQVYLAVKPGDLRGDGTLMAGRDTQISTTGGVDNSGAIVARNALVVDAQNVRNTVGTIQGKTVNLHARNDIDNLAGLLKGDAIALTAGRDITLTSSTQSNVRGGISNTLIDGVARIDAGTLNVQAGRDVNARAAAIAATRDASIRAGVAINLTAAGTNYAESFNFGKKNRSEMRTTEDVGTRIAAAGNLTLMAAQDIKAIAAQVSSDKQLAMGAGRNIDVLAGDSSGYTYNEIYYKTRGFWSSKTTHRIKEASWTAGVASTFTGDTTMAMAGRDVNVVGSNVGAQRDLVMSGGRDVDIVAGENTSAHYDYEHIKKSGFGAMGGLSYGTRKQTDILDGTRVFHTASTVGSVQGDTLINAGRSLNVVGSNVLARQGDVAMVGRDVRIGAVADTASDKAYHEVKQSGFSINASTPLVSAMQTAGKMGDAAGRTDNKVMQGLALATTGWAGVNAHDAIQADPRAAGGLNISIDLGSSKSQSTTKRESSSVRGSTVAAEGDLTVLAQGGGQASNVTVTGSSLSAGNDVAIKADGDIVLRAARNTSVQHSTNKRTNASIGVGVTAGSRGLGFTLNVAAGGARGKADGKDIHWSSSTVTAGKVLGLQSGRDTSLIGAVGQADRIVASVGNNLRIETLQDISTYASKQQSAGIAGSLCYGYCTSSISGNVSQGQMKSNFKSASEQAGLKAGDGGFNVGVRNNTTLIGGLIASSGQAVADGRNTLATGTLLTENVKNSARYKASQVGISGGYGWGGSGGKNAGLGTDAKGNVASGSKAQPGTSVPQTSGGPGMGTPAASAARGRDRSTTYSAISGGTELIRDAVAQQDLSGMTATETLASLNRDTSSDTLNALKPIFDKEKIEAGFEIVSESQRQVGQFLTNRTKEAKALEEALKNEPEGPRRDQLQQALEAAKTWGPAGESRRWLTAIVGAASGNVTGAAGDAIQAVAVNYLQGLAASQVKEIVSALGKGPQAEAARAAMHTIVGCAGAAGKGSDCSAGALGAGSGAVLNALLGGDASAMTPEEKEARRNLVGSLVAGIAHASGVSGAEAVFAATNETENNALSVPEHQARIQEKAQCNFDTQCERRVTKKYKEIDDRNRKSLAQCASLDVCQAEIEAATARLGEYNSRIASLEEKLRSDGGLSASEWEEWSILKISASVMLDADRNAAIKNYLLLGGDQAKQLAWDEITKAGVAGAAAAVGAVGSSKASVAGVKGGGSPTASMLPKNFGESVLGHNTQIGVRNSKSGTISGAHNRDAFLESVEITGAKVTNKITDAHYPGLVDYSYQLPRLNTNGELIGGYKPISTKTTYDPKILPDSKVADMSRRAAIQAVSLFINNPTMREASIKVDGYYFKVTRNSTTGEITNSFITMPPRKR